MSVIVMMRLKGDPAALERLAAENPETPQAIRDRAIERGVIAHRFYANDDGEIMVVDEWPDAESFQSFFADEREQIQPMMDAAGVSGEPEVTFWRKLEVRDEVGWGA